MIMSVEFFLGTCGFIDLSGGKPPFLTCNLIDLSYFNEDEC